MAAKLMGSRRLVAYMPNLRTAVRHFRAFSSYDERSARDALDEVIDKHQQTDSKERYENILILTKSQTVWPDPNLGPLGPKDHRFPMPGLVGASQKLHDKRSHLQVAAPLPDILTEPLKEEKQVTMLQQFLNTSTDELGQDDLTHSEPQPMDYLECVAQECPELMKKDFQDLFTDHSLSDGPLTVITISQRTQNDMSKWCEEVEVEREELLDHFITGSQDICGMLRAAGYWADFIDPCSGRPYLGSYTNATMFETDERYRNFGFEIDDMGCCKVISHHLWGTHAFVGCLFTNAPLDHPVLKHMTINKDNN